VVLLVMLVRDAELEWPTLDMSFDDFASVACNSLWALHHALILGQGSYEYAFRVFPPF